MTLPIPPSDSLYKFTAIGGLTLVVLSLYLPWKMGSDLRIAELSIALEQDKLRMGVKRLIDETKKGLSELKARAEVLQGSVDQIEDELQEVEKARQHSEGLGNLPTKKSQLTTKAACIPDMAEQIRSEHELRKNRDEQIINQRELLENRRHELDLLKLQVDDTKRKADVLRWDVDQLKVIAFMTFVLGITMTVFGFRYWYFKFQVYQDQIIQAQAEQWTTPRPEREKEEIPG